MVKDEWDILRAEAEALGYAGMQAKYGPSRARTGYSGERYIWIEERNTAVRYRAESNRVSTPWKKGDEAESAMKCGR